MISAIEVPFQPIGEIITWNRAKLKKFSKAFSKAVKDSNNDSTCVFKFDGHEFLIGYAAYLITYLESKLK